MGMDWAVPFCLSILKREDKTFLKNGEVLLLDFILIKGHKGVEVIFVWNILEQISGPQKLPSGQTCSQTSVKALLRELFQSHCLVNCSAQTWHFPWAPLSLAPNFNSLNHLSFLSYPSQLPLAREKTAGNHLSSTSWLHYPATGEFWGQPKSYHPVVNRMAVGLCALFWQILICCLYFVFLFVCWIHGCRPHRCKVFLTVFCYHINLSPSSMISLGQWKDCE